VGVAGGTFVMSAIEEILNPSNLDLPAEPRIAKIEAHDYEDWQGIPSLRVHVVVESFPQDPKKWPDLAPVREAIFTALKRAGIELFPFIRFVTVTERASEPYLV
jgi:hypothetical protein